jgi:hypothetical protein
MIALLTIPVTRRRLFGTASDEPAADEPGWVTSNLVPWMRDRWWGLLLVLAVVVVVPGVVSYVIARRTLRARSSSQTVP